MDHLINKSIRSAKPNLAPGQFLPFVGVSPHHEEGPSGLMNIDGKAFVGQGILGANCDVKAHAGTKRSSSRKASATKKSAVSKTASKKTSKARKSSTKKSPKPKKKSASAKKASASKSRKNSAAKKPKPKKPEKDDAGAAALQRK